MSEQANEQMNARRSAQTQIDGRTDMQTLSEYHRLQTSRQATGQTDRQSETVTGEGQELTD